MATIYTHVVAAAVLSLCEYLLCKPGLMGESVLRVKAALRNESARQNVTYPEP